MSKRMIALLLICGLLLAGCGEEMFPTATPAPAEDTSAAAPTALPTEVPPSAEPTTVAPVEEPTAQPVEPTTAAPSDTEPVAQLTLESRSTAESNPEPPYAVTIVQPVLQPETNPTAQLFNRAVDERLGAAVDGFVADAPPSASAPEGLGVSESTLDVSYEVLLDQADLDSVRMLISTYFLGAAHPFGSYATINFDQRTGYVLELADLFEINSPYLDTIAAYCKQELTKRDMLFFEEGVEPTYENYQRWNLTPDGLLISFDPYQVAPYAAGPQEVLIPYSELTTLIDPAGPLPRLIK